MRRFSQYKCDELQSYVFGKIYFCYRLKFACIFKTAKQINATLFLQLFYLATSLKPDIDTVEILKVESLKTFGIP